MRKVDITKCDIGQVVFYKAKGAKGFESRLILDRVENDEYISLSPVGGGEMVLDDFATKGSSLEVTDADKPTLPTKVMKGFLEFAEMPTQPEFDELVEKADNMVGEIRESRAADAAVVEEPGGQPSGGSKKPFGGYTVTSPRIHAGLKKPDAVKAPALLPDSSKGGLSGGIGALAPALGKSSAEYQQGSGANSDNDDSGDVRTLPVLYDRQGQRFREFRQAVSQCEHHSFADWPIPGPPTVMWVIKWMVARGGTPLAWHAAWKTNGRLQDSEGVVLHHESNCRILETMLCYDQVNAGALASLELVCRLIQICEDKLSHRFDDSHGDAGSDYYLMSGAQSGSQLCICPELRAWIASEVQKESSVLKERRKAREERVLANPKKKGGKGGAGGEGG